MNRKKLPGLKGKRIRIRPPARRFGELGGELESINDLFLVLEASPDGVVLNDNETGQSFPLPSDHIHEYRTDTDCEDCGFLLLNSQVSIQGKDVSVEPLDPRTGASYVSIRMNAEFDEALRLAKGMVVEGPNPLSTRGRTNAFGVQVTAFTAHFHGKPSPVSYNSGSIYGLAPDTTYYVYAIDPGRQGGAVPYQATVIRHRALAGDEKVYIGRVTTGKQPR